MPLRPDLRKQLKQQRTGIWRDATQVRYDESGPRSNPGPVPRRSTAAPNPAAGFASPVLSCELSLAESLRKVLLLTQVALARRQWLQLQRPPRSRQLRINRRQRPRPPVKQKMRR